MVHSNIQFSSLPSVASDCHEYFIIGSVGWQVVLPRSRALEPWITTTSSIIEAQKDLFGFWGEIAWPDFPLDCDDVTVCKGVCLGRGGDAGVLDWMTAYSEPKRKKLK